MPKAVSLHNLRFGILIEQRDSVATLLERVLRYETLGFDTVWLADCFADPYNPEGPWFEAWTLLAGLAMRTSRIRLGTLATHVVYRNPAVLARQAMTVDHLSNGRLELGIGSGASEQDWEMTLGEAPWHSSERRGRLGEALAIIDLLFREQTASYEGQYYWVHDATLVPGPVQQPRHRLTIAAHGLKSIEQAAPYADAWNTAGLYWSLDPRSTTRTDMLRLTRTRIEQLENAARYAGHNPTAIERSILVGWEWPAPTARPWESVEAFREFVGTYQEMGFTEFIGPEPATPAEHETLERVAGEVIPELRAAAEVCSISGTIPLSRWHSRCRSDHSRSFRVVCPTQQVLCSAALSPGHPERSEGSLFVGCGQHRHGGCTEEPLRREIPFDFAQDRLFLRQDDLL